MSVERTSTVNIIGAGLCGSLLSMLLARRGHAVRVHERQPDPRHQRVAQGRSINLALAARGIRALRHANVFEPVEKLLVPMRGRMIHHPDGSTELQPYGQRAHEVIYSVSRAELNRILLNHAEQNFGVDFQFGCAAGGYDTETASLRLANADSGEEHVLDTAPLIAADGAGSVVRRAYDSASHIAPTEQLLPHGYKELTLPADSNGNFRLAPDALHIWPRGGYMLIALPNPGGDFTLTLFLPNTGSPSFETLESSNDVETFFAGQFSDVRPLLPALTEEFAANPVGLLGTVRCRHWHDRGRMLLIGDAAHAIVPFHGQGMNLAFEDCVLLDRLLESGGSWDDVFAKFEAIQLVNANAIADMALDNYVEMRDRVREPKFVLKKELAFELERRLPDHFIPRYSMVMFHDDIPYATARQRGALQADLLETLVSGSDRLADIDLDHAEQAARQSLPPLPTDQESAR
ncbi:MAG: NAD(P)/FAD-dependent oxidoreductase [Woeseia sp.]